MYLTVLALPLSTYVCLSLFGRHLGPRGTVALTSSCAALTALNGWVLFYEVALCACPCVVTYGTYFESGLIDASWGFLYDTLTAVMVVVVTNISALVVIYSCSYMINDPHFVRFMSYLKLFTVAMLVLVTGDNYAQLFAGWEGVGLASFLLISFWFTRLQASKAAIQAMMLNRVGDIGLALGLICLYFSYGSLHYRALFATLGCLFGSGGVDDPILGLSPGIDADASMPGGCTEAELFGLRLTEWAAAGLFIGAMGKSGQFGLHAWLPNAMNAPTPVSALLHAATMVTAGVFLLARSSPLFELAPNIAAGVTAIGAITTLFAGSVGLVQNDFKSVIAYSTCSQLGYMITICGLSHYNVAMFHLTNHAFFKALLFLTAGAVIHSLSNQQDVRRYGGLQQVLIFSYTGLLIGSLALVGTPFLAGFYSKDVVLELAASKWALAANFGYLLTCFSVLTTSYYSFRLLFATFHSGGGYAPNPGKGSNIARHDAHGHDAPNTMIFVLVLLALGSVTVGWLAKSMFIGLGSDFWNNSLSLHPRQSNLVEAEFLPLGLKLLPLVATTLGCALAYGAVNGFPRIAFRVALAMRTAYRFLSMRWYYDKLLNEVLAYPGLKLGYALLVNFDKGLLELLPVFGVALPRSLRQTYLKLGLTQSGLISHYAYVMIFSTLLALVGLSTTTTNLVDDGRTALLLAASLALL